MTANPGKQLNKFLSKDSTLEVVFDLLVQESFERILAMYLPLLERLGPRRSDEINSASRMCMYFSRCRSILNVLFH
jgi:hypothetical protein